MPGAQNESWSIASGGVTSKSASEPASICFLRCKSPVMIAAVKANRRSMNS
jgi:hypothetical protein